MVYEWTGVKSRKTGEVVMTWKQLEWYPTDLSVACRQMRERMVMDESGKKELTEIRKIITKCNNAIVSSLKEVANAIG